MSRSAWPWRSLHKPFTPATPNIVLDAYMGMLQFSSGNSARPFGLGQFILSLEGLVYPNRNRKGWRSSPVSSSPHKPFSALALRKKDSVSTPIMWRDVSSKAFRCNTSTPLVCVANKELTQYLSALDATLTQNTGWGRSLPKSVGRPPELEI